jgi:hypothetical protein
MAQPSVMKDKRVSDLIVEEGKNLWGGLVGGLAEPFTRGTGAGVREGLWNIFEPLALYSPEAHGGLTSNAGKSASRLAELFHKWYKEGNVTVNAHARDLDTILSDPDRKLKNQMELTSVPEAWNKRVTVEKNLLGIPAPLRREGAEARKHPVYGHVYHKEFQNPNAASSFGRTHLDVDTPTIREGSRYVLGDSFDPYTRKAFSHSDMMGQGSALERALYYNEAKKPSWVISNRNQTVENILKGVEHPKAFSPYAPPYMEALIPNELAKVNQIKRIVVPESHDGMPAGIFSPRSLREMFTARERSQDLLLQNFVRKQFDHAGWDKLQATIDKISPEEFLVKAEKLGVPTKLVDKFLDEVFGTGWDVPF